MKNSTFGSTFKRLQFNLKKNSPTILIVFGIIGAIGSTVLACKATLDAAEVVKDIKHQIDQSEDKEDKKEVREIYIDGGVDILKIYLPSIILGVLSYGGIIASHNILNGRNVALAAAYAAIDASYKKYRAEVAEKYGDEVDQEIRAKSLVPANDPEQESENRAGESLSSYARFFDDGCEGWDKDPDLSLFSLKIAQCYANDLLKANGYLFLNDVYKMLGIPKSKPGQVVGWIYDKNNPLGDNHVDFGIFDSSNERKRAFVNGYENVIILDFNVDGYILDAVVDKGLVTKE